MPLWLTCPKSHSVYFGIASIRTQMIRVGCSSMTGPHLTIGSYRSSAYSPQHPSPPSTRSSLPSAAVWSSCHFCRLHLRSPGPHHPRGLAFLLLLLLGPCHLLLHRLIHLRHRRHALLHRHHHHTLPHQLGRHRSRHRHHTRPPRCHRHFHRPCSRRLHSHRHFSPTPCLGGASYLACQGCWRLCCSCELLATKGPRLLTVQLSSPTLLMTLKKLRNLVELMKLMIFAMKPCRKQAHKPARVCPNESINKWQ
mmetsp:Transcript_61590/g.102478  ORF Transcript_61590/g.102478 Transcript_61590/m.102478 type:complete len:252 (-) Transcript_61590:186-941(-)